MEAITERTTTKRPRATTKAHPAPAGPNRSAAGDLSSLTFALQASLGNLGSLGFLPLEIRRMIYKQVWDSVADDYELAFPGPDGGWVEVKSIETMLESLGAACRDLEQEIREFAANIQPKSIKLTLLDNEAGGDFWYALDVSDWKELPPIRMDTSALTHVHLHIASADGPHITTWTVMKCNLAVHKTALWIRMWCAADEPITYAWVTSSTEPDEPITYGWVTSSTEPDETRRLRFRIEREKGEESTVELAISGLFSGRRHSSYGA
ncbi:hypothetical protein ANO11243_051350 [Dothideomycetidae sp. 11243]|nr:hypothetical protein ANO11243_051350 [fungal sp. No.11243]